jgi:hypothetical protein
MLHRVALVRIYVSEERIASITRVTRIGELGTTLAETTHRERCEEMQCAYGFLCNVLRLLVTAIVVPNSPILLALMMEAICSSGTSVLIKGTQCNIPEGCIIH